ncbi:DUF3304 domain-containing protein [Pseudomonas syringae]|uniref:DUF3304 domain-containing protein n=1 Tax=Pseudomonas syringae TaxID=317 RepID=UPI0009B43299|nr:DUF3304 domain-containing protein [Pseudomonas syringae]
MQSIMRKTLQQGLFILWGSALSGCSSASNEMAGGNLQAVNHTVHGINWMSVNGYRADGGGGASCCISMPTKWRPGLKANIEWEVDPEPSAKMPSVTSNEFREAYAKHAANYQRHSTTVDIPEWPGTESCDLKVHFLTCNRVKVTTACAMPGQPNYPIKEPLHIKEPAVCPK